MEARHFDVLPVDRRFTLRRTIPYRSGEVRAIIVGHDDAGHERLVARPVDGRVALVPHHPTEPGRAFCSPVFADVPPGDYLVRWQVWQAGVLAASWPAGAGDTLTVTA